jgi:outer membrane protein
MRKLFFVLAFGFATLLSNAQTAPLKIGYADVEYIFSQMPEAKQIESELQTLQTQLKKKYDAMVADFQNKLKIYQDPANANMPDAVRQNSERELQQLQQNIQKLEQDSQGDLQRKNAALLEPVQAKVGKAIEDVAKENGFSFILNPGISGADFILYGDEKLDVSDLVLKKLGITPTVQTPPAPKK